MDFFPLLKPYFMLMSYIQAWTRKKKSIKCVLFQTFLI